MKTYNSTIPVISLKKEKSDFKKAKITSSREAYDYIRQFYSDDIEIFESFFLLLLNRQNNTIGYVKISQGGTVGTVVDPLLLVKYVSDSLANGIILGHNHPSGNINPSERDIKLTKDIKKIMDLLSVALLDHIILTEDNYSSFADECIL